LVVWEINGSAIDNYDGEFTVVVSGSSDSNVVDRQSAISLHDDIIRLTNLIVATDVIPLEASFAAVAAGFGLRARDVRNLVKKANISAKRQKDAQS